MSFGYATPRQTTSKLLDSGPPYVRPSEWIALTPVGASEQKFTGLYAVYPNNEENYLALTATVSSGNYTIDWGDGTVENIASNTQANHQYNYASVGNLTSYGYKQVIITVTAQTANLTGINIRNRPNYIGVGQTNTWVTKWLDIEVGSPNLTGLTIGANNGIISLPLLQRVRWVSKSSSYVTQGDFFYWCTALQNIIFDCDMSNWNTMSAMFFNCQSLRYAPYFDTSSVTTMINTFSNCYNLISVPFYKTPALTSLNSAFSQCYKLKFIGGFSSTDNVTDMTSAFNKCSALTYLPTLNLPKAQNLNTTFTNDSSLTSISLSNVNNCSSFSSTFAGANAITNINITGSFLVNNIQLVNTFGGCNNLIQLNFPNTANVSNLQQTFQGCSSLTTIPITYTPNVTSMSQAYLNCNLIQTVPNMNTSNCTNFTSTFQNMSLISDAPNLDTSKATTVLSMYANCLNLRSLPAYNLSNIVSGQGSILGSAGAGVGASSPILTSNVYNCKFSTVYVNCGMNAAALTTVMNNLGSAGAASQILTITGNPGATAAITQNSSANTTSNVLVMANTVNVAVGQQITASGKINGTWSATLSSNKVSVSNFIDANVQIAFSAVTTSNAAANTIYYTSNRAGSGPWTYDISTSQGGTPITFTNGTASMSVNVLVTAINTNANVIMNSYSSDVITNLSTSFRTLNTNLATLKGFTVTG